MKRAEVRKYTIGTAEYVVLHARWSHSRGRTPSATLPQEGNPRLALREATRTACFPGNINLILTSEREMTVRDGDKPVASIKLDYERHMREVVLHAETSDEIQLSVLRVVVSHVHKYVRRLSTPEINSLDREALTKEIKAVGIDISTALYKNAEEAIDAALKKAGIAGLRYSEVQKYHVSDDRLTLEFSVKKPDSFVFWKSESRPTGGNWDLNVVPSYHPVMNEWQEVGLVNGATDYYIRGNAVQKIYCPHDARVGEKRPFGSSWDHVKHPSRAEGQDMQLEVNTTKMRSAEGVNELAKVLRASLGLDKQYVAISGGFLPPMKCPNNRLLEIKQRSPWKKADHSGHGHVARGSEAHCVWAHRTLESEGFLDQSYVPSWFKQEGWLRIYEGAVVEAGLY